MSHSKINGIETKIIQTYGNAKTDYSLVFADPEQAKEIVLAWFKETGMHCFIDDDEWHKVALATISKVEADPIWEVCDWRLACKNTPPCFHLCRSFLEQAHIDVRFMETEEYKELFSGVRELDVEDEAMELSHGTFKTHSWPSFNGRVMDQQKYDDKVYGIWSSSVIWNRDEARQHLEEIQAFWAEFKGESLNDAKQENPFAQPNGSILDFDIRMMCREMFPEEAS